MKITIDSDVLVYAFIEPTEKIYKENYEEFKILHSKADSIFKDVINGNYELIIPSTVLIEVAIVMSRAVGSKIAKEVYESIKKNAFSILYLNENFTGYCMEKGVETHLSGFDTVVFACAYREDSNLITGDRRFFHNVQEHHPELKAHFLREMNIDDLKK
jgi:predicted nucleic acid-binding protein